MCPLLKALNLPSVSYYKNHQFVKFRISNVLQVTSKMNM